MPEQAKDVTVVYGPESFHSGEPLTLDGKPIEKLETLLSNGPFLLLVNTGGTAYRMRTVFVVNPAMVQHIALASAA